MDVKRIWLKPCCHKFLQQMESQFCVDHSTKHVDSVTEGALLFTEICHIVALKNAEQNRHLQSTRCFFMQVVKQNMQSIFFLAFYI